MFETVPEKEHVFIINGFGNNVHQAIAGILFKPWDGAQAHAEADPAEPAAEGGGIAGAQAISFALPSLPGSTGGPPVQFVITTTADYPQLAQVLADVQAEAHEERPLHLHRHAT